MKPFHKIPFTPIKLGIDGGIWSIPSPTDSKPLRVVASDGAGWDHVSVSRHNRPPNWAEMCRVKDVFFDPEEVVMQLHPRKSEYVNNHPHCLHLWRPQGVEIPTPHAAMVGVPGVENITPEKARQINAALDAFGRTAKKLCERVES